MTRDMSGTTMPCVPEAVARWEQRRTSGGHDPEQENRPQPPEPGAHAVSADGSVRITLQDMQDLCSQW